MKDIQIDRGSATVPGVCVKDANEVQITIWCKDETSCTLNIYKENKRVWKIPMPSLAEQGMGDIFSVSLKADNVQECLSGLSYEFCGKNVTYQDPYAKAVAGREQFGKKKGHVRGVFCFDAFDWSDEKRTDIDAREMVLYQCHVRGFTKHKSSKVKYPGTFSGLQEKIPYLKELGVNTLLLMPAYDFDEVMKQPGEKSEQKINYWGYTKEAFYFAPKAGYCSGEKSPVIELKELVKALHQNGMNLIMDMHFENQTPNFILECLRFYAVEYHVDGFRINQNCMDTSWLKNDPILSHKKLLGWGWEEQPEDCKKEKLFEMQDGFMIDARRYLKSDEGQTENFYRRFKEQKNGVGIIHYITQHNGFTLRDLISYDVKHNEANGERNMDGTEYNYSWNCGFEGVTRRKTVLKMREKQEKNAFVMLLLGMAVPMILAGDEFGNSQKGNNNAYCQDNVTTWLDWRLLEKNAATFSFVKELLAFRKNCPLYHQTRRLTGMDNMAKGVPDVSGHGKEPWTVDFSYYSRELGILYFGEYFESESLYFAFNFHWDAHEFFLPDVRQKEWEVVFDTAKKEHRVKDGRYKVEPRSVVVFQSVCNRSDKSDRK